MNDKYDISEIGADKSALKDTLVIKKASALVMAAVEALEKEGADGTGALSGADGIVSELREIGRFLKECHLEHVATRTYDADKIVGELQEALGLLDKMHGSRLSKGSDWDVDVIRHSISRAIEEVPEAAMESDDAVDEILHGMSSRGETPLAKWIDYAIDEQFRDWNVDHSNCDPYEYRHYGEELKDKLDEIAGVKEDRW